MSEAPELEHRREANRAEQIYLEVKKEIFDFELLPEDRFTESDLARRMGASRTPVREALLRLEREGYVQGHFKSAWEVKALDFDEFEQFYDLRIVLELAAVDRICEPKAASRELDELSAAWLIHPLKRSKDGVEVCQLDERFHGALVEATGNREMSRVHLNLTERIRIVRRLDFVQPERLTATYLEHAAILKALIEKSRDKARELLTTHIERSKTEVRHITLQKLYAARGLRYEREAAQRQN